MSTDASNESTMDRILLPAWDQVTIRTYIQLAFCFPFTSSTSSNPIDTTANIEHDSPKVRTATDQKEIEAKAEAHIRAALVRLSKECPEFAAHLFADEKGCIWLERNHERSIPFRVVRRQQDDPNVPPIQNEIYEGLKKEGFPPGAFTHTALAIDGALEPGGPSKPVIQIEMSFLGDGGEDGNKDGLILWVSAHHSLLDGEGMRRFVQCFAAQTRGEGEGCSHEVAPLAMLRLEEVDKQADFAELVRQFPEYADLPDRNGPMVAISPPKSYGAGGGGKAKPRVEKILVFRHEGLKRLAQKIASAPSWKSGRPPSSYVSLAALMWAHITKVRVEILENRGEKLDRQAPARLTTPVDWRKRAFPKIFKNYLGNAVAIPFQKFPLGEVIDAACPLPNEVKDEFARLAYRIQQNINAIDEEYVAVRTKTFAAACKDDPRRSGLSADSTDPGCLGFNTWRLFSADTDWSVPGVVGSRPDAVRRVGASVGSEKAMILPIGTHQKGQDGNIEMLVWLTEDAMELLLKDKGFMNWVDDVVG